MQNNEKCSTTLRPVAKLREKMAYIIIKKFVFSRATPGPAWKIIRDEYGKGFLLLGNKRGQWNKENKIK